MTTFDSFARTFDKLFITTSQNIFGSDIKFCKWSFLFTAIGIGVNIIINSFYLIKLNNENKIIKNKINLLLYEQNVIIEDNISIHDFIKKNTKYNNLIAEDKENSLLINEYKNEYKNDDEYDFLNSQ
jgi:hypothetical protein